MSAFSQMNFILETPLSLSWLKRNVGWPAQRWKLSKRCLMLDENSSCLPASCLGIDDREYWYYLTESFFKDLVYKSNKHIMVLGHWHFKNYLITIRHLYDTTHLICIFQYTTKMTVGPSCYMFCLFTIPKLPSSNRLLP